jgi:hypothetical protein
VSGPDLWQPSSLQFQFSSSTESEPANIRIVRARRHCQILRALWHSVDSLFCIINCRTTRLKL